MEINPRFEEHARARGCWTEEVRHSALHEGQVSEIEGVSEELGELFRTAHEIEPEWHLRVQAAFQEHVDNAVSKTINLRSDAGAADVRWAYERAYDLGCKGITVYREGSKSDQVLTHLSRRGEECPECGAALRFAEATAHCRVCGYSGHS